MTVPQEVLQVIQPVINWIAPGAVMLVAWFIVKFINNREKFEDKVEEFKKGATDEIKSFKLNVQLELKKALDQISETSKQFNSQIDTARKLSNDMSKQTYEFQEKIIRDVAKVQLEVGTILNQVKHADNNVQLMGEKIKIVYDHLETIQKRVDEHQNSLGLGAQAFKKMRDDLTKTKSHIIQISDDVKMIKTKKQ